jgi:hypothetical protein
MEADLQPFQCQRLEKGEKLNLETGWMARWLLLGWTKFLATLRRVN